MNAVEHDLIPDDAHPIDIVETLAERRSWEFDRVAEDQISMSVTGVWRSYSLTLAWSGPDETLRLFCTFEMQPLEERLSEIARMLDKANDLIWSGAFTLWEEQGLMAFRYGLTLAGGAQATPAQVDGMLRNAVSASERFYPAFQLVAWGDESAERAVEMALADAVGRA